MKSILAILIMGVGLLGCTKICDLAKSSAATLSPQLVTKWACTNPAQMTKDIQGAIEGSVVCKTGGKTGVVGSLVCPVIVGFLKDQLANQVPASWGCNPALVGSDAAGTLSTLCSSIFPI